MQVFLSYVQADEAFAKALSAQLIRRGISVWTTDYDLLPGDNVWLRIGDALQKSNAMVVLISPDSMRSEYVRHEIEYALGNPNYAGRVFPVEVRPAKNIPWILQNFKTFDGREGAAKLSESIAHALKRVA